MKIIDSEKLEDFIKKHADANNAIEKWVEKIEAANWKNHNELKKDFLSADYVGNNRYVFNIRGNNYRLVSVVVFFAGTMVAIIPKCGIFIESYFLFLNKYSTVYAQTMPTQTQDRLPVPISTIKNLLLRFFHKNVDRLNSNSLRTKS